jgi:hypothetical protein
MKILSWKTDDTSISILIIIVGPSNGGISRGPNGAFIEELWLIPDPFNGKINIFNTCNYCYNTSSVAGCVGTSLV